MNFFQFIFQDWRINSGNTKGKTILLFFRIANVSSKGRAYYYLFFPYRLLYKIIVGWLLGIEIPWNICIGKNLRLFHGQALVLNSGVVIGSNCILRHCTTIGNRQLPDGSYGAFPVIGNNVDIGSNVCIIGEIYISDDVKIGCGAVVTKNISADCTVVGNPAVVKKKENNSPV
jgi:putative colanic acid biosynthesis acetyltransferase WcaB